MRFLDLFSGLGGFSLGLERAGHTTVAFCEIDSYCQRILKRHWPTVPIFGDIRELTVHEGWLVSNADQRHDIAKKELCAGRQRIRADSIDAVCGGFPCTDISVAGKGAGMDGPQSSLWKEYARILGELRPRYALIENVSILTSRGLHRILCDLAALGMSCEWHCIGACHVGAPHRRDRVWIMAYPQRAGWGAWGNGRGEKTSGRSCAESQRPSDNANAVANANAINVERLRTSRQQGLAAQLRPRPIGCNGEGLSDPDCKPSQRSAVTWGECGHWLAESQLGFSTDGFSAGLDGGRLNADAEKERPTTDVQPLRNDADAQADQRQIGGSQRILAPDLLQQVMHGGGLCQRHAIEVGLVQTSDAIPWELLRGVWGYDETARPSHRREQAERLAREYPDLMRELSRFSPPPCATCWQDGSWENGLSRVAHKIPARVDRLRALGNAVVPQIPELIGRAIMQETLVNRT